MYNIKTRSPPIFIKEGNDTMRVSIIILSTLALFTNLKILTTLNALTNVAFPPTET